MFVLFAFALVSMTSTCMVSPFAFGSGFRAQTRRVRRDARDSQRLRLRHRFTFLLLVVLVSAAHTARTCTRWRLVDTNAGAAGVVHHYRRLVFARSRPIELDLRRLVRLFFLRQHVQLAVDRTFALPGYVIFPLQAIRCSALQAVTIRS